MAALDHALDQLRLGHGPAALDALLAAWRAHPAPSLAERIDRLDAHLVALAPPLRLGGSKGKHEAWQAAVAEVTSQTLSPLVDAIVDGLPRQAAQRLDWLSTQLDGVIRDPRLSRRAWAWLRDVPLPGAASRGFYERLSALLQAIDDPRWDAEILAADAGEAGYYTKPRLTRVGVRTGVAAFERLAAHVRARSPRPPLDDAITPALAELDRALDRLLAASPAQTEAELLAAIYAAPDDDAPRAIYADMLQQRGDPRGEFIALQLERARLEASGVEAPPSKRERSLLKQYGSQWVGALEPFILVSGRSFRRGFLAACRYRCDRLDRDPIGLPEWATIEALDASAHVSVSGSARLILQPHMTALRSVDGIVLYDLRALCEQDRPLPIEQLGLRYGSLEDVAALLIRSASLPELRVLRLANLGGVFDATVASLQAARPALTLLRP